MKHGCYNNYKADENVVQNMLDLMAAGMSHQMTKSLLTMEAEQY